MNIQLERNAQGKAAMVERRWRSWVPKRPIFRVFAHWKREKCILLMVAAPGRETLQHNRWPFHFETILLENLSSVLWRLQDLVDFPFSLFCAL